MRNRHRLIVLTLTALSFRTLAADLSISGITVDRSPALPGEPIWVTLSIRNSGPETVPVPLSGVLEAVPEDEEAVVLRLMDAIASPLNDYRESRPSVGPGETLRLDFVSGKIAEGWLQEARLWSPGRHRLRVVLFDGLHENAADAVATVPWRELHSLGLLSKPPIVSPDAPFVVQKPTGSDAEAWAAFINRTDGAGFSRGGADERASLAYDLATQFPDSAYAPYFAISAAFKFRAASQREERQRFYDEMSRRHPDNAALAHVALMTSALAKAHAAEKSENLATALAMLREAKAMLETYASETPRTLTRLQIRKQIEALPSREAVETVFALRKKNHTR